MTSFWAKAPKDMSKRAENKDGRFILILKWYWNDVINLKITILKYKLYKQLFKDLSIFSKSCCGLYLP